MPLIGHQICRHELFHGVKLLKDAKGIVEAMQAVPWEIFLGVLTTPA